MLKNEDNYFYHTELITEMYISAEDAVLIELKGDTYGLDPEDGCPYHIIDKPDSYPKWVNYNLGWKTSYADRTLEETQKELVKHLKEYGDYIENDGYFYFFREPWHLEDKVLCRTRASIRHSSSMEIDYKKVLSEVRKTNDIDRIPRLKTVDGVVEIDDSNPVQKKWLEEFKKED